MMNFMFTFPTNETHSKDEIDTKRSSKSLKQVTACVHCYLEHVLCCKT